MGFWATWFVRGRFRRALRQAAPRHRGHQPPQALRPHAQPRARGAPAGAPRAGVFASFDGNPLEIGDDFFRPGKVRAKVGETVTWNFGGTRPHSVTVANGPRGFSSVYWGRTTGQLQRHADREGHLQAGLPRPPHDDGADARGEVAAGIRGGRRAGWRSSSARGRPGSSSTRVLAQRSASLSSPVAATTVSVPPPSVARAAPNRRRRAAGGRASRASTTRAAWPPRSTWRLARSTASSAACA